MIKYFCDGCGVEVTEENMLEGKQYIEIGQSSSILRVGLQEDQAFCRYCVIDAVKELDDRPTQGEIKEEKA